MRPLSPKISAAEIPAGKLALTIDETCAALSLGRTTVHELTRRGKLRSRKVGRRVIIPISAIAEFLDGDD